jgi:hypothetical protein
MNDSYLNSLLGENERILFTTRRHWTVLAGEILSETVLSLALVVLVTILLFLPPPIGNPLWALGYLLLAFPAVSLLHDVMVWASRKYVVTTQRVVNVEGVLSKQTTDSSLEKVNDVKLDQSFAGRLMGYGDVQILTASELGASRFTRIANPIQFKTAMLNAKQRLGYDNDRRLPPAVAATPARTSLLESALAQREAAGSEGPSPGGPAAPAPPDILTLVRQLDDLRQAGVLTEAEFQNKKAQLLARL